MDKWKKTEIVLENLKETVKENVVDLVEEISGVGGVHTEFVDDFVLGKIMCGFTCQRVSEFFMMIGQKNVWEMLGRH